MRFLANKDLEPLIMKLGACYALEYETVEFLKASKKAALIYQLKVEFVSIVFWFLKAPYPYPEKVKAKLMEVIS